MIPRVISIVCYLWRGSRPFRPAYVGVLARMVRAYLCEPHRFICVTDADPKEFDPGVEVIAMPPAARALRRVASVEGEDFPASYPRLWTFSREAALFLGERVLQLDVDCMIVGSLARLLALEADFVGWSVRPPPGGPPRLGGGTWMHRTGTRPEVYERFAADPLGCRQLARQAGYRGSDQAWISYCLAGREPTWPEPSGIYCAQDYRNAWRKGVVLPRPRGHHRGPRQVVHPPLTVPPDAVILHMNGKEKPWDSDDAIVRAHWRPFYDGERADAYRRHLAVE